MLRSSNPALTDRLFNAQKSIADQGVMTIEGSVNRTLILLALVLCCASYTWGSFFSASQGAVSAWMIGGAIVGLIAALVTAFKPTAAPYSAPIYACAQGFFLGGLSAVFEAQYPGIAFQAIALTFGTLFCLLAAYKSRLIVVTNNFKMGIAAATGGIALVYFVSLILGFFGVSLPFIFGSGPFGILFSVFVVTIAALNLVMDFDFIERAAESRNVPKYMEWYAAFGLMVTLIWLYIEVLRLLSKLRSNRN